MADLYIEVLDHTYVRLLAEPSVIEELAESFTFLVPGYKNMPQYKKGHWNGTICLINRRTGRIYRGLLNDILEAAKQRGYSTEIIEHPEPELIRIPANFYVHLNAKYEPRDYQREAFEKCIAKGRAICLSPTASGKSFILYLICRLMMLNRKRTLIVVPTVGLTTQMQKDFIEYHKGPMKIHTISAGITKTTDAPIVVSTWQSLVDMDESWFAQFDCIIGDEAHRFKAKSLTDIMEKCNSVQYRFGFTGTLDDSVTHEMVLRGLFGDVFTTRTTAQLINRGDIANLKIHGVIIHYDDAFRKSHKSDKYIEEIETLVELPERNRFLTKLIRRLTGTTLVLFRRIEHGKILEGMLKEHRSDVYRVDGLTPIDERETIRQTVIRSKSSILIASYGVYSTGINIPNINNIVIAHPLKSKIAILQSIGRGLRLADDKDVCHVYDICDALIYRSRDNFAYQHFRERLRQYLREDFSVTYHPFSLVVTSPHSAQLEL